jgi:hypothetical protein
MYDSEARAVIISAYTLQAEVGRRHSSTETAVLQNIIPRITGNSDRRRRVHNLLVDFLHH